MKTILAIFVLLLTSFLGVAQYSTLVSETFSTNANNWVQPDNADAKLLVNGSNYYFENRDEGQYLSWLSLPMGSERNFEVWAMTQHLSGVENYGYGLVFGGSDQFNCYEFLVSKNGYFKIGYYEYGTWKTIMDWTVSSALNTYSGSTNDIGVVSINGLWHFLIGETEVATLSSRTFFGSNFGLAVENRQAVAFDDFEVISGIYSDEAPVKVEMTEWVLEEEPVAEEEFEWTEEDEKWLEELLDEYEDETTKATFPDPGSLPVNRSLVVPSGLVAKLQLVVCDYPNNFASVRGEKLPAGDFFTGENYASLLYLDGFDDCYFNMDFAGNRLNFHANFVSSDKTTALRFYDDMKLQMLDVEFGCSSFVFDETIDEDPESVIPFVTYWIPFNLSEPAATVFREFVMELEFMKSFNLTETYEMVDEWIVTLRIKSM